MANYAATLSTHQTLTAATVDAVTLDDNYGVVEVLNRDAAADLYVTVDGNTETAPAAPVILGDATYIVRPGASRTVTAQYLSTPTVVRLISAAAVAYSVTGLVGKAF